MDLNLELPKFVWSDENWIAHRKKTMADPKTLPLNIYEIDLGSWKTRYGKTNKYGDAFLNYGEISCELISYMKEMGYTHVVILPRNCRFEIVSDPDPRFGSPEDFMAFVNALHRSGIGIILDLITLRKHINEIPEDLEELSEEDIFNIPDADLCSELSVNACYWIENYHIDGIRAETDCIYGCEAEAAELFESLNFDLHEKHPDIITVAMLTDNEKVSYAENCDFTFVQNSQIAHDLFEYGSCDPYFRRYHHDKVIFKNKELSDRVIIPVTHADVEGGRKALLDKMFGLYEDKFSCYKALMCHEMAMPGKKMMFMGSEFGQFREWDRTNQLEWFMLDYDMHRKLRTFVADINDFYLKTPEFQGDIQWINKTDGDKNVVSYLRKYKGGEVVCVMNFSGVDIGNYYVYVDRPGTYDIILNSDEPYYGGSGVYRTQSVHTDTDINGGHYLSLNLAKLSGLYLRRTDRDLKAVLS